MGDRMTAARRRRGLGLMLPAILAVIVINGYAYSQLLRIAKSWRGTLLPGAVSLQLSQLALILAINCFVIIYLLITRR